MRPPHYTGEDRMHLHALSGPEVASMRPPHYTGEDPLAGRTRRPRNRSFNEAPALHGGRPFGAGRGLARRSALQ